MWLHDLQIEITLAKSDKFDELMAAANEDKEAADAQEQNWYLFFFLCFVDDLIILFLVSLLKHFLFILILAHFECYRGLWCFLYLWTFLFTDRSRWILLDKVFEYNIRFETLTQSKLGGIWILVNYDKKKG